MRRHEFHAFAFAENLPLRGLQAAYPAAERAVRHLRVAAADGGAAYLFPFGVFVALDLPAEERASRLAALRAAFPHLGPVTGEERLAVVESPGAATVLADRILTVDRLTAEIASVVALVLAQSVAMEYYEGGLDGVVARTQRWIARLERRGTAPLRMRTLHRFLGETVALRSEVLSVLHLLDRPDEVWRDATLDAVYEALRSEFELGDRFHAVELRLRSAQEALELVLDVVRDRRMVLLEAAIVLLVVTELLLGLLR